MGAFASLNDLITLWRPLNPEEVERATALLPLVSDALRVEADKVGKDLDAMAADSTSYASVLKSVVVDIVARTLLTSTEAEPMIQSSESALGYSVSGTFLVPGGGLFIKTNELARLGLRRQRLGTIELFNWRGRSNAKED